jgi:lysophospholipase L1-like esterase
MRSLVLFGDSLLARCRKGEEKFLTGQLNNEYEIYNCATGGWDSNDLLRKAPLIGKLHADVVIISIGTNDACTWKLVDIETFKANLGSICDAFSGSRIIFFPPPPINESRRPTGRQISNETMHEYNQAIVDFCTQHSLEFWDTWIDLFPLVGTDNDPHNEDGVHFSDEGYKIIFEYLAKVVLQ